MNKNGPIPLVLDPRGVAVEAPYQVSLDIKLVKVNLRVSTLRGNIMHFFHFEIVIGNINKK